MELLYNPQMCIVCGSFRGLFLVSFQQLQFHLDHALAPSSERPSHSLTSSEFHPDKSRSVYSFFVSCTPAGHCFVLLHFQCVEECLKVRPHVRKCMLGTVCPEQAQQCFHAMLPGQPSWPVPLDSGFCSPSKLCLKPWSTKIPFLYLGSLNTVPSTSGVGKIRVGFSIPYKST